MTTLISSSHNSAGTLEIEVSDLLTIVRIATRANIRDAEQLISHLEQRLAQGDKFCLLFESEAAWEPNAALHFNSWWQANKMRLNDCQAVAMTSSLPRRSRLLTEFLLTKELAVPCKCFRHHAQAKAWVSNYAEGKLAKPQFVSR